MSVLARRLGMMVPLRFRAVRCVARGRDRVLPVEHNLKGSEVVGWDVVGSYVMEGSSAGLRASIEDGRPDNLATFKPDLRDSCRLALADEDDS